MSKITKEEALSLIEEIEVYNVYPYKHITAGIIQRNMKRLRDFITQQPQLSDDVEELIKNIITAEDVTIPSPLSAGLPIDYVPITITDCLKQETKNAILNYIQAQASEIKRLESKITQLSLKCLKLEKQNALEVAVETSSVIKNFEISYENLVSQLNAIRGVIETPMLKTREGQKLYLEIKQILEGDSE